MYNNGGCVEYANLLELDGEWQFVDLMVGDEVAGAQRSMIGGIHAGNPGYLAMA